MSDRLALAVRLASGAVFLAFGAGKFTNHASEVASFRDYGLPSPDAFVSMVFLLWVGPGRRALDSRFQASI